MVGLYVELTKLWVTFLERSYISRACIFGHPVEQIVGSLIDQILTKLSGKEDCFFEDS